MQQVKASFENYAKGLWVHYSKLPQLTINPDPFHQDPAGLYLFPESFETEGAWHRYPYRIVCRLKPGIRVLDLPGISHDQVMQFLDAFGMEDVMDDEYLDEEKNFRDRFWDIIRQRFMGNPGRFNKAWRRQGYDAIFDDGRLIHSAEIQLVVLNPRFVEVVKVDEQKATGYDEVNKVLDTLSQKYGSLGEVKINRPTQQKNWGEKQLSGSIEIKYQDNYATIKVSPWFVDRKGERVPETIVVSLLHDSKGLTSRHGWGVDLKFRNFDSELHKLTDPRESIALALKEIFGEGAKSALLPVTSPMGPDFADSSDAYIGPPFGGLTWDTHPMLDDPEMWGRGKTLPGNKSLIKEMMPLLSALLGEPSVTENDGRIEVEIDGKGTAEGFLHGADDLSWWFQKTPDEMDSFPFQEVAILEHVEVDARARRESVGTTLVKAFCQAAKKHGAQAVFLNASPFGSEKEGRLSIGEIVSFYKSLGFQTWQDEGNSQVMYKNLGQRTKAAAEQTIQLKDGTVAEVKIFAFNHDERAQHPDPKTDDFKLEAWIGKKIIGYVQVYHQGARVFAFEVHVQNKWRRQGVASGLYNLAQELTGKHIYPNEQGDDSGNAETSDDAIKFWKKRGVDLTPDEETESNFTREDTSGFFPEGWHDDKTKDPGRLAHDPEESIKLKAAANIELYCDQDGVLSDFDQMFRDHTGKNPKDVEAKELWTSIDRIGGFWTDMDWMPDGPVLWEFLKPYNPTILSAPSQSPHCIPGKRQWLSQHVGEVPAIFEQKKEQYATPNAVLIDDRESNIKKWKEAGGIGILHTSADDSIRQLKEILGAPPPVEAAAKKAIKLYHGTNKDRLKRIETEGLDPLAPKASQGEDYIYLTDKPEIAAMFSGRGQDQMGMMREGYSAPQSAKKQNGVILEVKVDPKFLDADPDQTEVLRDTADEKKLIKKEYQEILEDMDNPTLRFEVENKAYELAKGLHNEDDSEMSDEDINDFLEHDDQTWADATEIIAMNYAKKAARGKIKEAELYRAGKMFRYEKPIPPEDIVKVEPAGPYLKGVKKYFGTEYAQGAFDLAPRRRAALAGAKGDWKQEGYTFKLTEKKNYDGKDEIYIECFDKAGKQAGHMDANESPSRPGFLYPVGVQIKPEHSRKGIATEMYRMAEEHFGMPFLQGNLQSPEGKAFRKVYDKKTQSAKTEWLTTDDLYTIEMYVDESVESDELDGIEFKPRHKKTPKGKAYRSVTVESKDIDLNDLVDPTFTDAWTFSENVAEEFAELMGDDSHPLAVILEVTPRPEQVICYMPSVVRDFKHEQESDEFYDVIHTIEREDEVVLKGVEPSQVKVSKFLKRDNEFFKQSFKPKK